MLCSECATKNNYYYDYCYKCGAKLAALENKINKEVLPEYPIIITQVKLRRHKQRRKSFKFFHVMKILGVAAVIIFVSCSI